MKIIDKRTFFEITEIFYSVPFTQSKGWWELNSVENENRFAFFVDSLEDPTFACMGHIKKCFGLKMLQIEGECSAKQIDFEDRKQTQQYILALKSFCSDLQSVGYNIIEIRSNTQWNFNYEIALRQAGYLRPVGLFSTTATRIIDLTKQVQYDRNWERNIKKAEEYNLKLEIIEKPSEKDCADFCFIYNTMSNRKLLNHHLSHKQIFMLCSDKSFQMLFVNDGDMRIAAFIIFIDNKTATSEGIFTGSTEKALEKHATFFIYNEMFQYLKSFCKSYNMAKLTPSISGKLFQFKNGIQGKAINLNGEYSWYKHKFFRPLMYFVKKYLFKEREV